MTDRNVAIFAQQYGGKGKNIKKSDSFLYTLLTPFISHRHDKIASLIDESDLNILEIGCSDGKFLYKYRSKWKTIFGVDILKNLTYKANLKNYNVPAKFI